MFDGLHPATYHVSAVEAAACCRRLGGGGTRAPGAVRCRAGAGENTTVVRGQRCKKGFSNSKRAVLTPFQAAKPTAPTYGLR